MMVRGNASTCSPRSSSVGFDRLWVICLIFFLAGLATLLGGCAEVNNPANPPAPIPIPSTVSSVDTPHPVSSPYSLAILPFEDYSNRQDLSWLRQGLPDMLVTDLALLPGVRVVSRHRLGEVLREQWLQHRGAFEEASSVRLGRLVGARYLLSGLYYVGGEELILEVHLLDVEQGAVVRTFRVTGSPQDIPGLELELASSLGQVFDSKGRESHVEELSSVGNEAPIVQFDSQEILDIHKEIGSQAPSTETQASIATTLRTDTVLGLERLKHVREAAASIAHDLWSQALDIRLGNLNYQSHSGNKDASHALTVNIPVSATIREKALTTLDAAINIVERGGPEGGEIVLGFEESDAGAQQLFREALQAPRRLFVRAIRESGEVLAVSSEWSWRMDLYVHIRPDGTVGLPRSSSPFLMGNATFWGALLSRQDATITFDALVLPVPEESRTVSVEVVEDHSEDGLSNLEAEDWVTSLRTWLDHRWHPSVAESIPTSGYLPGNRRHAVALVSGKGGTIAHIQIVHIDEEEKFADSVDDALRKLPGECFWKCENSDPKKSAPQPFTLRIQFELNKDLRHAGLGRLR
ncbi:CsgG/HfaB family protein [Candidatus Nitronereus thalassa]|uniref:CsgG/HfaB family protein n=1 Tax=Candidatus Nitronereus thalassa TaxID=3020898 RepID=A0ABU3K5Z9_9BACT|nr:CsgG/HfaB family protein [Candidatus Nitronereus thalassa]MDT7041830.1 CsgG/HfaB family protein [Candidatus Nitronereus thalassa]